MQSTYSHIVILTSLMAFDGEVVEGELHIASLCHPDVPETVGIVGVEAGVVR